MDYNPKNAKGALITGAARRIGAEIAKSLHAKGYHIALHCFQSLEEGRALVDQFNRIRSDSAQLFVFDLSDEHHCQQLIDATVKWKIPSVLVNNASVFIKDSEAKDFDTWLRLFSVNVRAPYLLSQGLSPYLSETSGNIINITDIHAQTPLKEYSIYCQTKAALSLQTKAFAKELAPHVKVNAIAPGAIMWPEHHNVLPEKIQENIVSKTLLKRHGHPQYIAEMVLSLIQNPFITGQEIKVDGGRL